MRFVYEELRKRGYVRRTEIEADVQEITPTLAAGLGLVRDWGVVVSDVEPGGPAYGIAGSQRFALPTSSGLMNSLLLCCVVRKRFR